MVITDTLEGYQLRFAAISRKVVGGTVHATIPKGIACGFQSLLFFKEILKNDTRVGVEAES